MTRILNRTASLELLEAALPLAHEDEGKSAFISGLGFKYRSLFPTAPVWPSLWQKSIFRRHCRRSGARWPFSLHTPAIATDASSGKWKLVEKTHRHARSSSMPYKRGWPLTVFNVFVTVVWRRRLTLPSYPLAQRQPWHRQTCAFRKGLSCPWQFKTLHHLYLCKIVPSHRRINDAPTTHTTCLLERKKTQTNRQRDIIVNNSVTFVVATI